MRPHGGGSGSGSRIVHLDAFGRANALIVPHLIALSVAVMRAGWAHVQFADSCVVAEDPTSGEKVTFRELRDVRVPTGKGRGR